MPRDPAALSAIVTRLTDTSCLFLPESESWVVTYLRCTAGNANHSANDHT